MISRYMVLNTDDSMGFDTREKAHEWIRRNVDPEMVNKVVVALITATEPYSKQMADAAKEQDDYIYRQRAHFISNEVENEIVARIFGRVLK